ncbi:MAG: hypothetical protein Q9162_001751 [Coniocarpon cinnabarinum]
MTSLSRLKPTDIYLFADCNLDPLTETYNIGYYLDYMAKWPSCCFVMKNTSGMVEGYLLGKLESSPPPNAPTAEPYDPDTNQNPHYLPWHAHITALTVAPDARRQGHAQKMTEALEREAERKDAWFIDLFVRADNVAARKVYDGMGYTVYRKVVEYYADGADAFDMRKPLKRDKERKHVRENGESFEVDPAYVW